MVFGVADVESAVRGGHRQIVLIRHLRSAEGGRERTMDVKVMYFVYSLKVKYFIRKMKNYPLNILIEIFLTVI